MPSDKKPRRGEIWIINFDPTIGSEIKKKRPAVVLSADAIGVLPVKLVAPITEWDRRFASNIWHVLLNPEKSNGLIKSSAVDALQMRSVDIQRFVRRIGRLRQDEMNEITMAVAAIIELE